MTREPLLASTRPASAPDRDGAPLSREATSAPARPAGTQARRSIWRRHWRRWLAVVLVATVAAIGLGAQAFVSGWSQPPLHLPETAAAAPTGMLDGQWTVGTGSVAGFRIEQTVLGLHGDIVGRTDRVTGGASVSGTQVVEASFAVDLTSLTGKGRPVPRLQTSLETDVDPTATFTLDGPLDLGGDLAGGTTATFTVDGGLAMRGQTHPVSATIQVRRDGDTVEVSGSIPVDLAAWGVGPFEDAGPLGSIAGHGTAEFLLVLVRG
jgi:polyisoprenoid-binding protein YceI